MGHVNVDRMLATLTPQQVDEWWASARLEGWDNDSEWRKFGLIASQVHNSVVQLIVTFLQKEDKPTDEELDKMMKTGSDFIPEFLTPEQAEEQSSQASDDEIENYFARRYG